MICLCSDVLMCDMPMLMCIDKRARHAITVRPDVVFNKQGFSHLSGQERAKKLVYTDEQY